MSSPPPPSMRQNFRVSLVIPCYNEEDGVREVIQRTSRDVVDEIVVVDNNCTDRTAEVARSLGAVVVSEKTPGYGAAYKAGLRAATGDIVITLDGDGTYPPEAIPGLVDMLVARNWDFLSACRFPLADPKAMGLTNQLGNWVLTTTSMVLFFKPIQDSQSGMWVFKRSILPRLRVTSDGMPFSQEIKLEAILRGFRFGETHIHYGARIGEVKLQKWRDGWLNLLFLFQKRFGLV